MHDISRRAPPCLRAKMTIAAGWHETHTRCIYTQALAM